MDAGTMRGIFTFIMLTLFVAICWWAYSSRRRDDFEEAAQLPLQADDLPRSDANRDLAEERRP